MARTFSEILRAVADNAYGAGEQGIPCEGEYHAKLLDEAESTRERDVILFENFIRLQQAANVLRDVLPGYGIERDELHAITKPLAEKIQELLEGARPGAATGGPWESRGTQVVELADKYGETFTRVLLDAGIDSIEKLESTNVNEIPRDPTNPEGCAWPRCHCAAQCKGVV